MKTAIEVLNLEIEKSKSILQMMSEGHPAVERGMKRILELQDAVRALQYAHVAQEAANAIEA